MNLDKFFNFLVGVVLAFFVAYLASGFLYYILAMWTQ